MLGNCCSPEAVGEQFYFYLGGDALVEDVVDGVEDGHVDKELCSSATMCRFENMVDEDDLLRIQEMFLTMFILSYGGKAPGHIILDSYDTNVDTYGNQKLTFFNAYYDSYCYMPMMVFEGYTGRMILLHSLLERALGGTRLEKASILTVCEKLLLYAVSVRKLKTKIIIDFAKNHHMIGVLRHCLHYYSVGHPT